MYTRREAIAFMSMTGAAATLLSGCSPADGQSQVKLEASMTETKHLRILATSDLHGMMVPWDYTLDAEDQTGSMAKLATAIKQLRDENTLLVDVGDTIQGNMAELFIADNDHPMIVCMNALGYEIGVTGNHEYNFGMDVVRKAISSFSGTVLTGNVTDETGKPIADGYTILDKDGVRVGLIGMVTPLITQWDAPNLKDCKVDDPVDKTRAIIDQIKDEVDVLIGVMHMGVDNEDGWPHTGVRELVQVCPEFDLVVAAHAHKLVEGEEVNGVLVVENKFHAQTMSMIDLTLSRDGDGWKVAERTASSVEIGAYDTDPDILELLAPYDERAKRYSQEVVGSLEGGPLTPANEFEAIPQAVLEDTALIDLIHEVQLHHADAAVSSVALLSREAQLEPGPIRRCDTAKIYVFSNTLYTLEMTGAQLKKYMEWSASFFQTLKEGDLTISFDPDTPLFNYDMFQGVNYKINVSKEAGGRIEDLCWPDGTPVADDDVFVLATNNYRANTHLLTEGALYEKGDMPKLLVSDVHSNLGGIREMINDYIENVKGGQITPTCDNNWSLVGINWDQELHRRAAELVADGKLALKLNNRKLPIASLTEQDVRGATA